MSSHVDPEPVNKPAAAPRPAASGPAPPVAARPAAAEADRDDEHESIASEAVRQAPAWAVSTLVHVVVLLAMALVVSEPPAKPQIRQITSTAPETEDEFTEFEDDQPQLDAAADPTAEVAVTTDMIETPVEVVADATDVDAAPLQVELSDFGTETAPASDMMASIGAIGGTAGGLGGRAQAANLAAAGGGGADTEQAVDRALQWIAGHQLPDGGWSFDLTTCPSCGGKCSHSGVSKAKDRCGA